MSKAPETGALDDSWEDIVGGALSTSPPAGAGGEEADIFDRATSVPTAPPGPLHAEQEVDTRPGGPAPLQRAAGRTGIELDYTDDEDPGRAALLPGEWEPPTPVQNTPTAAPAATPARRLPLPGRKGAEERRATRLEPAVERSVDRVAAGEPAPAEELEFRGSFTGESASQPGGSPLELVDAHYHHSQSTPGMQAPVAGVASAVGPAESGTLQDMQDRYAVGDFTGALVVAESILDANPDDEDARRYAQSCREVLTQMYAARIGNMDQVASVAVPADQITWLSLDHRAGFLLSLIDGISSIEVILDISGMSRLDALRIMYTLVQQNVVVLRP